MRSDGHITSPPSVLVCVLEFELRTGTYSPARYPRTVLALLQRTSATASTDRPSSCHRRCVSIFDCGSRGRTLVFAGAVSNIEHTVSNIEHQRCEFSQVWHCLGV